MVEPVARIRPFQASDDTIVRFVIGKGSLESLAVANRKGWSRVHCHYYLFLTKFGFFSILPSFDPCAVGTFLIYFHPNNGLVA